MNLNVLIKKKEHQVTIHTIPSNQGFVTFNNVDYNGTINFSINHGEELNLFAKPNDGYVFQKWVSFGGLLAFPTNRSLNLTVEDDLQIAGYFSPLDDVTLEINIEPAGLVGQVGKELSPIIQTIRSRRHLLGDGFLIGGRAMALKMNFSVPPRLILMEIKRSSLNSKKIQTLEDHQEITRPYMFCSYLHRMQNLAVYRVLEYTMSNG